MKKQQVIQFDFYPLIVKNGIEPYRYEVDRIEVSAWQEIICVNAFYKCRCCENESKESFKFYIWKLPTNESGVFDRTLNSYEIVK